MATANSRSSTPTATGYLATSTPCLMPRGKNEAAEFELGSRVGLSLVFLHLRSLCMPGYNVFVSRSASFVVFCDCLSCFKISVLSCQIFLLCFRIFMLCIACEFCVLYLLCALYLWAADLCVVFSHVYVVFCKFVLCSASLCCILRLCVVFPDFCVVSCDYVLCFRIFVLCFMYLYCVSYVCFVFCTCGPPYSYGMNRK